MVESEENRVVLEEIMDRALKEETSDIHFLPLEKEILISFREAYGIGQKSQMSKEAYGILIQRMKALAHLNISEKRLPQDGMLQYKEKFFRINLLKSIHGESMVLRQYHKTFLTLQELGVEQKLINQLFQKVKETRGLHLMVGETGMGKTTTYYALLRELCDQHKKVISIEDPVEQQVKGIVQCQVAPGYGFTYERAIFAALRQDPDIIALGEIRNSETARMVLRAALTGHPVVSTLHAYSYGSAFDKLLEFGLAKEDVEETLSTVFHQQLIYENGRRKAYGHLAHGKR